jgi:hypothetical protein
VVKSGNLFAFEIIQHEKMATLLGNFTKNHVAHLFNDTEAIYSYEGMNEIDTLVGRAITEFSAFV